MKSAAKRQKQSELKLAQAETRDASVSARESALAVAELVPRKVSYQLYPSKTKRGKLDHILAMHQRLYNGALEHRIGAYRKAGDSISYYDQAKELTILRRECEEYSAINAQSLQVTLKRLDKAYQNFFRRVKNGEKAGFPRFKSLKRFRGWGYATHGDGWRFHVGKDGINGSLRISGVGYVQARGRPRKDEFSGHRCPGTPKVMEIIHEDGKWYASVTFKRPMPRRKRGYLALGIDWGTLQFLTVAAPSGQRFNFANPRLMREFQERLKAHQKLLARKKRALKTRINSALRWSTSTAS